jgi:hypothetical protein
MLALLTFDGCAINHYMEGVNEGFKSRRQPA